MTDGKRSFISLMIDAAQLRATAREARKVGPQLKLVGPVVDLL
jgi:hypothetical protein